MEGGGRGREGNGGREEGREERRERVGEMDAVIFGNCYIVFLHKHLHAALSLPP